MQKKIFATYLSIFLLLLLTMSLSQKKSEKLRGSSVALFAPLWEKILSYKHFVQHPSNPDPFISYSVEEEMKKLQIENQLLLSQVTHLEKQLEENWILSSKMRRVDLITTPDPFLKRNLSALELRTAALPARVIFRSFDSWNHSLWINVGENHNGEKEVNIALNSPVVVGSAIVGIIDYVGKTQSRVRLITDHRLNPSVRAVRGGIHHLLIHEYIENLSKLLKLKKSLSLSSEDQLHLFQLLDKVQQNLKPYKKTWYLAKGILLGSASNLGSSSDLKLKGSGFNYDFDDTEGESRNLRTGTASNSSAIPLLKENDLLITTGMDGIFPPDFQVALVTSVGLLKEGDYHYELEAKPLALPLEELSLVFVLPPYSKNGHELK